MCVRARVKGSEDRVGGCLSVVCRRRGVVSWVGRYRRDHSTAQDEEGFRSESAEIRRLRAELRNARMENEFLKKAAAYFAREQK